MEGWKAQILEGVRQANEGGLLTLIGVLVAILTLYLAWRYRPRRSSDQKGAVVTLTPTLRQQLLDRVQSERIQPRLEQGLLQAIRIDLGLTETPGAVVRRLSDYRLREGADPPGDGPIRGTIREIFERRANGQLLILGDPGTGKTNLLLELGQSLIADARMNDGQPIPIVFNLPRWTLTKKDRTLAQWMRDDLAAEYGLSAALARTLVEQDGILPLLDGLDEVADTRQAACVEAIHVYQKSRPLGLQSPIAVCCRREEYESLPRLELSAAIRIEKLTRVDVERETGRPGLEKVRAALDEDPELWEIIDTPLMLHVLYGAAQTPRPADSGRGPKQRLYARYVEYALGRDPEDAPRRQTDDERLKRWLGWLAARMRDRDQSQFAFEDLWLPTKRADRVALAVPVLVMSVVFGLAGRLLFRLAFGSVVGLALGLFLGLLLGLAEGLGGETEPEPTSQHPAPRRGAGRSQPYAVLLSAGGAILVATLLSSGLQLGLRQNVANALALVLAMLGWFGVLRSYEKGFFALRHYTVRLFLWLIGLAPLRYVRFLNECADRLFLIRRGGSYEFFHITFRDFMADEYGRS